MCGSARCDSDHCRHCQPSAPFSRTMRGHRAFQTGHAAAGESPRPLTRGADEPVRGALSVRHEPPPIGHEPTDWTCDQTVASLRQWQSCGPDDSRLTTCRVLQQADRSAVSYCGDMLISLQTTTCNTCIVLHQDLLEITSSGPTLFDMDS